MSPFCVSNRTHTHNKAGTNISSRYSLLAYINTITITGELVIRPMMYHFSSIDLTDIQQFLLGEDLMVVPIMAANQSYTERDIYFPDKYYDFRFGYAITDTGTTKYPIHASPLLIFVRIGRIIPIHQSRVSLIQWFEEKQIEWNTIIDIRSGPIRRVKRDWNHWLSSWRCSVKMRRIKSTRHTDDCRFRRVNIGFSMPIRPR